MFFLNAIGVPVPDGTEVLAEDKTLLSAEG